MWFKRSIRCADISITTTMNETYFRILIATFLLEGSVNFIRMYRGPWPTNVEETLLSVHTTVQLMISIGGAHRSEWKRFCLLFTWFVLFGLAWWDRGIGCWMRNVRCFKIRKIIKLLIGQHSGSARKFFPSDMRNESETKKPSCWKCFFCLAFALK